MFEKLFDAGVFERKLGTLDATIRNTPLPEDRKQAIRAVFTNWGLIEPRSRTEVHKEIDAIQPQDLNRRMNPATR